MSIRDRIKELRRVRAGELRKNPANWRRHGEDQRRALGAVLAEIGYVDALIARELPDGQLELIDGHCRRELTPDTEVPVLIVDLDDNEAATVLATLDPLSAMAEADDQQLGELLMRLETENEDIQEMLEGLAEEHGVDLFEPHFEPVGEDEQSRLDEKVPVKCPKCGHEFTP